MEESQYNAEGIALHMAIEEKEWIEANFGVVVKGLPPLVTTNVLSNLNAPPLSPTTPVSPTGGNRLAEKLKGLRLGTSEKDLTRIPMGKCIRHLSPPHFHSLNKREFIAYVSIIGLVI